jgi:hypothetical protein
MPKLSYQAALDLVPGSAGTIYNNANLGTAIVQMGDPASTGFQTIRRACITNKHATNVVSFILSAACTSFVASAAGTIGPTEGIPVLPNSQYFINFSSNLKLFITASAGSTPVQVALFDTQVTG